MYYSGNYVYLSGDEAVLLSDTIQSYVDAKDAMYATKCVFHRGNPETPTTFANDIKKRRLRQDVAAKVHLKLGAPECLEFLLRAEPLRTA